MPIFPKGICQRILWVFCIALLGACFSIGCSRHPTEEQVKAVIRGSDECRVYFRLMRVRNSDGECKTPTTVEERHERFVLKATTSIHSNTVLSSLAEKIEFIGEPSNNGAFSDFERRVLRFYSKDDLIMTISIYRGDNDWMSINIEDDGLLRIRCDSSFADAVERIVLHEKERM